MVISFFRSDCRMKIPSLFFLRSAGRNASLPDGFSDNLIILLNYGLLSAPGGESF